MPYIYIELIMIMLCSLAHFTLIRLSHILFQQNRKQFFGRVLTGVDLKSTGVWPSSPCHYLNNGNDCSSFLQLFVPCIWKPHPVHCSLLCVLGSSSGPSLSPRNTTTPARGDNRAPGTQYTMHDAQNRRQYFKRVLVLILRLQYSVSKVVREEVMPRGFVA